MNLLDTVEVTLRVPLDRLGDAYAFCASLFQTSEAVPPSSGATDAGDTDRLTPMTILTNYAGGESEYWRPFLEALADHPDEWVEWTSLCSAIGLTPRQASGMLGAGERRCKGAPPYDKKQDGGQHWFRMPAVAATIVREHLAAKSNTRR